MQTHFLQNESIAFFPVVISSIDSQTLGVLAWATIGGILVFAGLILEKVAEWMNERFLGGWNCHKVMGEWGWIILMIGILIEVVVAGGTAIDDWQTKKMDAKNKPRSLTLAQIRGLEGLISQIPDKPPIRVFLNEQAADAHDFGIQLAGVFSESGFRFNGFMEGYAFGNGIFVGEFGETNSGSGIIVSGLKQCGFVAETNGGFGNFPKEIVVVIQPK